MMMSHFLQEISISWVQGIVFKANPNLLREHGYASSKEYSQAAIALGVVTLSDNGKAYILRYEEAWSLPVQW
jgi:hypothetical protein